jgi:hypothetical protein
MNILFHIIHLMLIIIATFLLAIVLPLVAIRLGASDGVALAVMITVGIMGIGAFVRSVLLDTP